MPIYIARKIGQALVTVFAVLTIGFFLGRLSGKPGALILPEGATQQEIDAFNAALGFDKPLWQQYLDFLAGLFTGTVGDSYRQKVPAMDLLIDRIPATFQLAIASFAIGLGAAMLVALLIFVTRWNWLRLSLLWLGSLRQAIPDFLFGVLLAFVFSVLLGWLPSLGNQGPQSLVLPVACLATAQFALYLRLIGSALGEQQGMDYVRASYAKGQSHRSVVVAQMTPNALVPVLTIAGLNLGGLLGGTVIVEAVFAWPGMGQVLLQAVNGRDFPVVLAGLAVVAVFFVLVNLIVDLITATIDPRVRLA
ncbi:MULTISPECIES: ABC transporter permease [Microbacterium]|uniref:ABC transporter permease n=1 Tax=Microbacterium TaxID=33882 RepID=UPI002866EB34|nr:ABC transporter permease [Microbacterium trichothecenolyticum]MDR7184469.1 peptide/nickel transport system permease protein [Microbacterium trichothecenolyticum]